MKMKRICHWFGMKFSGNYARKFNADQAIALLRQEIGRGYGLTDEKVLSFSRAVLDIDPTRIDEVCQILVDSTYYLAIDYAVQLQPHRAKEQADIAMQTARRHLELCGHTDRASWARSSIFYARKWHTIAGCATQKVEDEMDLGMWKTEWVVDGRMRRSPSPGQNVREFLNSQRV